MEGIWLVAFILQWVLLLLLTCLVVGILRYLGSLQEKLYSSPDHSQFKLGERVSDFELPDIHHHLRTSDSLLRDEKKTLLFFLNSTCGSCNTVIEQIAELARRVGGLKGLSWYFVLVCSGEALSVNELIKGLPLNDVTVLVDKDSIVTKQYGIQSNPFAMAIDSHGELYSQSANPASSWLYTILDVPVPLDPSTVGYSQEVVPVLTKERTV